MERINIDLTAAMMDELRELHLCPTSTPTTPRVPANSYAPPTTPPMRDHTGKPPTSPQP